MVPQKAKTTNTPFELKHKTQVKQKGLEKANEKELKKLQARWLKSNAYLSFCPSSVFFSLFYSLSKL